MNGDILILISITLLCVSNIFLLIANRKLRKQNDGSVTIDLENNNVVMNVSIPWERLVSRDYICLEVKLIGHDRNWDDYKED